MVRKKRFLVSGIILFIAIGSLAYWGFSGAATYYYEVNEFLVKGSSVYDQNLRLHGMVDAGSVEQDAQGAVLQFTIRDMEGGTSIPVFYQGEVPDTFKAEAEVVIEGQLNSSDGVFRAHTVLPKCASKYEPVK